MNKIQTVAVLAMSADGKIADYHWSGNFSAPPDKYHLQKQVAWADAVLLGHNTLKCDGTSLQVTKPELLELRRQQGKPDQPINIVCSRSTDFDLNMRFFSQNIPRWLVTTEPVKIEKFDRILAAKNEADSAGAVRSNRIDWQQIFTQLSECGLSKIAVVGGGQLVASILEYNLIDEFWLTVCPLIIGGQNSPSPVSGQGFLLENAPRLELLAVHQEGQEVFLHYRMLR